jgi:hypothetical protein
MLAFKQDGTTARRILIFEFLVPLHNEVCRRLPHLRLFRLFENLPERFNVVVYTLWIYEGLWRFLIFISIGAI